MAWQIEFTDEFAKWWNLLSEDEQGDIDAYVTNLEERGPMLPFPYSSDIKKSRHGGMRELRVQSKGSPLRVFYAFDPRRTAILLIGGDKTGNNRFYEEFVPIADHLFDEHLIEIESERKKKHGKPPSIRTTSRKNVPRSKGSGRRKG